MSNKKRTGEVRIIRKRCKGCGFCVEYCPFGVLVMSKDYSSKGYHFPIIESPEKCVGCNICGEYCPDFAIWGNVKKDES